MLSPRRHDQHSPSSFLAPSPTDGVSGSPFFTSHAPSEEGRDKIAASDDESPSLPSSAQSTCCDVTTQRRKNSKTADRLSQQLSNTILASALLLESSDSGSGSPLLNQMIDMPQQYLSPAALLATPSTSYSRPPTETEVAEQSLLSLLMLLPKPSQTPAFPAQHFGQTNDTALHSGVRLEYGQRVDVPGMHAYPSGRSASRSLDSSDAMEASAGVFHFGGRNNSRSDLEQYEARRKLLAEMNPAAGKSC